jgi:glucokinase
MDIVIGVDIGGSMVRLGAIDTQGELLALREAPIEARRGPQYGLERIASLIAELLQDESVKATEQTIHLRGIGIGCSGPVDPVQGVVKNPYTLPTWENVPLKAWLEERFSVPVTLENDADVAALGEYWKGAGKGVRRLFAVTVGTGIGTALIVDGQIYRGVNNCHPEGGHHLIDPGGPACYCGAHGCWESLAAGPAIARIARDSIETTLDLEEKDKSGQMQEEAASMRASPLLKMDLDKIDARLVAEMALHDDPLAMKIMKKAAYYFSLGMVNIVLLFTPDMIVLSGGVMSSAELFMPTLMEMMQQHNVVVPADQVQIREAKLGAYAGLYGAAYTILQGSKL